MTGTVHTLGSSVVFLCCLVQPLCSSIHAYDSDFVHGELAVSLSKQLRVHFIQCLVTLNVLPSGSQRYFSMHMWQRDEFRPIIYIFCAVWKSIYRSHLSNLYSVLALLGMPAVSWKKFAFADFVMLWVIISQRTLKNHQVQERSVLLFFMVCIGSLCILHPNIQKIHILLAIKSDTWRV